MDTKSVRCLTNSISRFVHLVSCLKSKAVPIQKDIGIMGVILKHMKPVLDEVIDDKISANEALLKECEELDFSVNESRELLEKWSLKRSRIVYVLQITPLLTKSRKASLEICRISCKLLRMSASSSSMAGVQVCTELMHCTQELQNWLPHMMSEHIEQTLRGKSDKVAHSDEALSEIIELLELASSKEFLKENIAVEKERMKALVDKSKEMIILLDQALDLLSRMRDFILQNRLYDQGRLPAPSYFRCPLSLNLMSEPVIVAFGQTFERASIQKWIDSGLKVCPKTRQHLSHTNLIRNYTIMTLIGSWCQENNIQLPGVSDTIYADSISSLSSIASGQDIIRTDSFRSVHSSNSTSRSSTESGDMCARQKVDESLGSVEEDPRQCQLRRPERSDHSSSGHSYTHSRTQSASSAISSNEFLPTGTSELSVSSNTNEKFDQNAGEIQSESAGQSVNKSLSGHGYLSAKSSSEIADKQKEYPRTLTMPSGELRGDEQGKYSYVRKLVEDLRIQSIDIQTAAAAELRCLAKHDVENRNIIQKCGSLPPLISLMYSNVKITQEHAVTALLNLSINDSNKPKIVEAGGLEPFIHVLKSGNDAAKENSAASLFSLSALEEFKLKIGRSEAIKLLVDLLGSGTVRGKKDAATALFNLSISHENKARIVKAGAVKYLVDLLEPDQGMVDKAVALLANLSTTSEGCLSIVRDDGIPMIVEVLETGSSRGKENAASILLQLCLNSSKFCTMVLQEGAVPPLVALSQFGTPRAREKAAQLLSHFRSLREGAGLQKK